MKADDLIQLKERGRGAFGVGYEMRHQETGTTVGVKKKFTYCSCSTTVIRLRYA